MKKRFFSLLMVINVLLCFFSTYINFKYPYVGIEVLSNEKGQYIINNLLPTGAAKSAGIQKGDLILSINGDLPEKHLSIKKYGLVEKAKEIIVQRKGINYSYRFETKSNNSQLLFHFIFPFILLFFSLFTSIFLMKYKHGEKVTTILILLLQLYGLSTFVGAASARTEPVTQFFAIGCLMLIPMLVLHFFFLYFQKYHLKFASRKIVKSLYLANCSVLFLVLLFLIFPLNSIFYMATKILVLLIFVLNAFCCIYYFAKGYIKYRKTMYGSLYRIINVGILLSFMPFSLLYAFPIIILREQLISGEVAFIFTYFLPLTFVYLVSTNRFLDINFYIKRFFYYFILAFVPTLVITIIVDWLGNTQTLTVKLKIFGVVYLLFIFVFYVKEQLDFQMRSKLFTERYNLQSSIYQLVSILSREKNRKEIRRHFVNEIKSVLGLKNIALLEYDKESDQLILVAGDSWNYERKLLHSHLLLFYDKNFIGELQTLDTISYIIVSNNTKKMVVLVLGEKKNFTTFNLEETEWIKTISYYMNISYENLQMIEELIGELESIRMKENAPSWLLKMLFQIEEKERKRLSTDLHDSVLQDQLVLYRKLSETLQKYHFDPLVKEELSVIKEGLLDIIHEIRETCNELIPPFLKEIGIVGALKNLFKKVQLRTNIVIDFIHDSNITSCHIDDEMNLTLYRIVQELMNNAEKHANASKVSIHLTCENDQILLKYRDDGAGLNDEELSNYNGRLGIYGIKERVRSMEGTISFRKANENGGLELFIKIPLQSNKVLIG